VLVNWRPAHFSFLILKGNHLKRSIQPFSAAQAKLSDFVCVPDMGPEGNGVSFGEGGEGRPGPPESREDKQSTLSEEGGNMEKAEEGRTSRA
jgi:hypothetical protein